MGLKYQSNIERVAF